MARAAIASQACASSASARARLGQRRAARGVGEQARERVVQRRRVAGRDELGRAGRRDLGEAADGGEHAAARRSASAVKSTPDWSISR